MAQSSDKPLPHNLDAEKSILGAILLDNHAFTRALDRGLRADDFFQPEHQRIFRAMDAVHEDGMAVDLVTLTDFLHSNGQLEACNGPAYISSLVDGVPAITNVEHYTRIVKEKAELRHLLRECHRLMNVAHSGITAPQDIRGQLELLLKTSSNGHKAKLVAVDVLQFLSMKLNPVEFVVDPVVPVQGLVMVFAKRGIGKTYFVMTLAYDIALGTEKSFEWRIPRARRVLLVDGEMPANVLQERLQNIMKGSGGRVPDVDRLRFITPDLQEMRSANISTGEGQRMIEEYLLEGDVLILDNLSALSRGGGKENEAESWDAIQEWFLHLRQRMISVILLHHAGKSGTQRGTGKREDVLDTIIELRSPSDYDQSAEGSRFEVHFDKMRRSAGGNLIYPFEARLDQSPVTRGVSWTMKPLRDVLEQRAFDCFNAGMNPRDVCEELHINRFKAHRLKKKWEAARAE